MVYSWLFPINHLKQHPAQAYFLSGTIALIIIGLSLSPLEKLPDVAGTDKTHHIIAYGLLAIPTAIAVPKRIWILATCYLLLGGIIELIQPLVNRYGEWLDFGANLCGVVIGSALGMFLHSLSND